jgi:hypothetical protein
MAEAGVVIDHRVNVFKAGFLLGAVTRARLAGAVVDHAMASTPRGDATKLLDVDMHELAGMPTLVAVGRLWRIKPGAFA